MAGADAAGRSLSDLPNDLLRHILFFAPAREGAATAVLSRRWRWLWRTSGAVNLDSRSFSSGQRCSSDSVSESPPSSTRHGFSAQEHDDFLHVAEEALAAAAANAPIRRLTLFVEPEILIDAVVSNPAARHVEELRIEVHGSNNNLGALSFGSLPPEALRVLLLRTIDCSLTAAQPGASLPCLAELHLQNCSVSAELPGATFPRLSHFHLQECSVSLEDLQIIIDAAPQLSTLHLASSYFSVQDHQGTTIVGYDEDDDDIDDDEDKTGQCYRLLCPSVTALVFSDCILQHHYWKQSLLELDVPRLQYFRYKGRVQLCNILSLNSQAISNMIQVDLHLTDDFHAYEPRPAPELFWPFLQNFNTTKLLKLKMDFTMDDLTLEDKASRDEVLGALSFCLLERLELEAEYKPAYETSMVMLANLLHCCPMVRDLQLKFSKRHENRRIDSSIDKEARVDFDKSVNAFRNRKRPMGSSGGDNQDKCEVFGIPASTTFSCLQSHLKKVSLHFFVDEPNCLGVQLTKYFAENAMVLQEMHIDDGCHEMLEHINASIRRWIANTDTGHEELNVTD